MLYGTQGKLYRYLAFITYYLSVFNISLSFLSLFAVFLLFLNLNFICWIVLVGVYLKYFIVDQSIALEDNDVLMAFLPFLLATLIRKVK